MKVIKILFLVITICLIIGLLTGCEKHVVETGVKTDDVNKIIQELEKDTALQSDKNSEYVFFASFEKELIKYLYEASTDDEGNVLSLKLEISDIDFELFTKEQFDIAFGRLTNNPGWLTGENFQVMNVTMAITNYLDLFRIGSSSSNKAPDLYWDNFAALLESNGEAEVNNWKFKHSVDKSNKSIHLSVEYIVSEN